ncbi:MAG: ATP-binding protein, partial [Planctomycetota bacterium]
LWVSLAGYACVFASSFLAGCRRDCPETGLLPATDFAFAILLVLPSGGLDSPLILASAFVLGVNGLRMRALQAAIYAGAAASVLLAFQAASGGWTRPHDLFAAGLIPVIALLMSYLSRYRKRMDGDRARLRLEVENEAQEIEELKRRIEELRERVTCVETLASVGRASAEIVHQIRDPLSAISLNLELLEEDLGLEGTASEEVRGTLVRIEKEVETLGDLAENYLQYARLAPPVCRLENLNDIVEQALEQEEALLLRGRVVVRRQLSEGLPPVRLDGRQVKFALHNLLENAREAMQDGGRLKVATAAMNGTVTIRVSDTGPGIPSDALPKIFDAFFTTKHHGTGLGLSMARKIVEQHGGELACVTLPDVGTTFELRFPVGSAEENP